MAQVIIAIRVISFLIGASSLVLPVLVAMFAASVASPFATAEELFPFFFVGALLSLGPLMGASFFSHLVSPDRRMPRIAVVALLVVSILTQSLIVVVMRGALFSFLIAISVCFTGALIYALLNPHALDVSDKCRLSD